MVVGLEVLLSLSLSCAFVLLFVISSGARNGDVAFRLFISASRDSTVKLWSTDAAYPLDKLDTDALTCCDSASDGCGLVWQSVVKARGGGYEGRKGSLRVNALQLLMPPLRACVLDAVCCVFYSTVAIGSVNGSIQVSKVNTISQRFEPC